MSEIDLLKEINSLSKIHSLQRNDIDQIMIEFAGRITRSLNIERMSVWLLKPEAKEMISLGEFDLRDDSFTKDRVIPMSKSPEYFEALEKDEVLYVKNVLNSTITSGIKMNYCIPHNIITLLDMPLRFEGKMIGVMCFEKTGNEEKEFTEKEHFFAQAISMVFSSNLEARKRRALQTHLDQELREKETLLKEIHHRVKNNLSVVSSLISLQSNKARDPYHKQLLDDCRGKVQSIVDIHDIVYQTSSFTAVNVRAYFSQLLEEILQFYDGDDKALSIALDIDDFELSTQTLIPLGLIVNEIVTNSFKHAFKERKEGEVSCVLRKIGDTIKLTISDDGDGFDEDASENSQLGMEIVNGLADQIDATFTFSMKNGVTFHLEATV